MTTTRTSLHPENETRLLSLTISDSSAQTAEILRGLATERPQVNTEDWKALQRWIQHGDHRVSIPYARELAEAINPLAVRLRRDFTALLTLIKSHALLHQQTRARDDEGRILATLTDYAAVKELVVDLVSEGVEATVEPTIRETVAAVAELENTHTGGVTVRTVAERLRIDKSAASRRCRKAIDRSYLQNLEERRGKPYKLTVDQPMPEDRMILPEPEQLMGYSEDRGCTVAPVSEGSNPPALLSTDQPVENISTLFDGEVVRPDRDA